MNDYLSFRSQLKALRRAREITQVMLAQRVGCAVITIQKIEGRSTPPLTADCRTAGRGARAYCRGASALYAVGAA